MAHQYLLLRAFREGFLDAFRDAWWLVCLPFRWASGRPIPPLFAPRP